MLAKCSSVSRNGRLWQVGGRVRAMLATHPPAMPAIHGKLANQCGAQQMMQRAGKACGSPMKLHSRISFPYNSCSIVACDPSMLSLQIGMLDLSWRL